MDAPINSLLSKLAVANRIANEKLMCEIGLHAGQAQVLVALWENGSQSQADLVRKLCVSAPTVNKMVSKLADSGFVTSERSADDKRIMNVRLTGRGARIQSKVEKQLERLESILLRDFSETERLLLPILLKKMLTNLNVDRSQL